MVYKKNLKINKTFKKVSFSLSPNELFTTVLRYNNADC